MTIASIQRLHALVERNLFCIDGTLGYDRTVDAVTTLANAVNAYEGETESLWSIGESGNATLDEIIIGAHWFSAHYSGGQDCPVYAMGCATGAVYSPGYESEDETDDTYQALVALHNQ